MQRRIFALLGLLWLGLTLSAMNVTPNQEQDQIIKRVTKKEFKEQLEVLKDVQLIDVRTPGEFSKGTIEGAVNIDFRASDFEDQIQKLDKSRPVMIFCAAGGRSAKALQKFKALGFTHVLELEGGYGNW